jgi:transcriptional regulator with XRE-family HTH domain
VILRAVTARKKNFKEPTTKRSTSFEPEVAAAIGVVTRRYREAAEIAQDAFALEAGVDRSYYGKLERGERQPSIGVFLRIAVTLQVSGADLMREVEAILSNRRRSEASELATARKAVARARAQFAHQRQVAGSRTVAVREAALRAAAKNAQERAASAGNPAPLKNVATTKRTAVVASKPTKAATK